MPEKSPKELEINCRKYEALNFLPKDTMEMRIFASTVEFGGFMKNLEFAAASSHWVLETGGLTVRDLSVERFLTWVNTKATRYPQLTKWMAEKVV